MADGSEPPAFGDLIFQHLRASLVDETAGMTIVEAAAHFDITLVFHDLDDGSPSTIGKTDDDRSLIFINQNLRAHDQEHEFYDALTLLALSDGRTV